MSIPSMKQHKKWLVAAAILLTVAGLSLAPMAFARLVINTIHPQAIISDNGRHLIVTGPCQGDTPGERAYLRVTITQRSTGAVAEGVIVFTLTGELQQWEVDATTQGKEAFETGPATAVAIVRTASAGATSDAHQWLVNITLVSQ
jgi:hypothetical protein